MQENVIVNEKLILDGRRLLSMTGIESVDGFSDQVLKLTMSGNKVCITGENIKITAYNKGNGSLTAEGDFCEIKYNAKKVPLVKRLFK